MSQDELKLKDTLNLPRTDFPMKANLPQREGPMLATWKEKDLYRQIRAQSSGRPQFHLHDGPPFANGDIHLGHALNKILKDIVVRYKTMRGFDAPYIPGWDCHGLPIEHKVVQDLADEKKQPVIIRKRSEKYARKYIDIQREQFKRLGIFGEWDKPYLTLDPAYEADILRLFADFVEKKYVYQGYKPVHWSTGCQTALAEAEVEYQDRTDTAVFVRFEVDQETLARAQCPKLNKPVHLVVWTTTPWTLPANLALAVHGQIQYHIVEFENEYLIVAKSRLNDLESLIGKKHIPAGAGFEKKGSDLGDKGVEYLHPFIKGRRGKIFTADFVTSETGSGIVHIAPGHGNDDYLLGQKHGLELLSPVDDNGCLTKEAGLEQVIGMNVFEANPVITGHLKKTGRLLAAEEYVHSYPHCWRSKTPIIFRSVKQWFINVGAFKQKALAEIERVSWYPAWGKNRITGSVGSRQDWCISRQRTWGVPIPAFYSPEGEPSLEPGIIRKFADIVETEGTNVWFTEEDADLCRRLGVDEACRKGTDTLDVWIDSGSSFKAVVSKRLKFPADLYLEGSDQHRGWFQSSLLIASAIMGEAPYKSVLTHGFVVDGDGKKMSKSIGNVISPEDVIKKYGADILRLWVAASDYHEDIRLSEEVLKRTADAYRKIRNTFRYLLANLADFDPAEDIISDNDLEKIDRWALGEFAHMAGRVSAEYDKYLFHKAFRLIYDFCTLTMSSAYLDILKDRLYADGKKWKSRRSAQTVMYRILKGLAQLAAPLIPFTADELHAHIPGGQSTGSIHLERWPEKGWAAGDADCAEYTELMKYRDEVLKGLEKARNAGSIGGSVDAKVMLHVWDQERFEFLSGIPAEELEMIFIVSAMEIKNEKPDNPDYMNETLKMGIIVSKSDGVKCDRCWRYTGAVTKETEGTLCARCTKAVEDFKKTCSV